MKRTSIRLICLLLCMLMVAPVLLSCKRDDPTPTPPAGDDSVTYTIESNIENNTVALVKKGDAAPTYELAPHITVTDNLPLTYTSSNEEVATVTEAGVVSAVAPGAATVTVANAEKNLSVRNGALYLFVADDRRGGAARYAGARETLLSAAE